MVHLGAVERRREVAEQPRAAEAAPADDDAGGTGLLDHADGVRGLPDVAVAEHRDVDVVDQPADGLPVGLTGVGLRDRASVQRDRRAPGLLGDPAGVEIGEVVVVESLAGLDGDRHVVRRRRGDRRLEDPAPAARASTAARRRRPCGSPSAPGSRS